LLLIPVHSFSEAETKFNDGKKLLLNPDYKKAYTTFFSAYSDSKKNRNSSLQASCLLELGKLSRLFSRNDSARYFLKEGIALLKSCEPFNPGLTGQFELALGQVAKDLGDIETAGEHIRTAMHLLEKTYGPRDIKAGLCYAEYSGYFSFKQQQDSALQWSTRSFKVLQKFENKIPEYTCPILIQYATSIKEYHGIDSKTAFKYHPMIRGLYKRAISVARSFYSLPSLEEGKALQSLANTYNDCIRPYFRENNPGAETCWSMADSLYKETIRVMEIALGKENEKLAVARYVHALIYFYHPGLEFKIKSLEKLNDAVSVLEPEFRNAHPLSCPRFLNTTNPYLLAVILYNKCIVLHEVFFHTGDSKYLVSRHEHNKTRLALWDKILITFNDKNVGKVINMWNSAPFEQAMLTAYHLFQLNKHPGYLNEIFLFAENGQNNEFKQLMLKRGKMKSGDDGFNPYSINLSVLQKRLKKNTVFVEYIHTGNTYSENSFALVVTANHTEIVKLEKSAIIDSLKNVLSGFMMKGDPKGYDEAANKLFHFLLQPVLAVTYPGIKKIIISPGADYSEIPFEALTVRKTGSTDFRELDYALLHFNISYALNAGMTFVDLDLPKKRGLTVFLPQCDSLPHLLFSGRQTEKLRKKYAGDFFFGADAKRAWLEDKCRGRSVVQIATHSIAVSESEYEGLLLHDGVLKLEDLYGKNIPVDLFIISACKSGSGPREYGEGTKSFARSFIYSGARGTISTIWSVDDFTTAGLLSKFYDGLSHEIDVVHSLSDAKKLHIKTCKVQELRNPFYWAGLIFTGDPELKVNIPEKKHARGYLFMIAIVSGILYWIIAERNFLQTD